MDRTIERPEHVNEVLGRLVPERGLTKVPYSECRSARALAARVTRDATRISSCRNMAGVEKV